MFNFKLILFFFFKKKINKQPSRNFKEKIQPVARSQESDTMFLRELNEP
jgi:hypothetical protein